MLASVEKSFVLLSNPKTGTTSLESAFRKFADIKTGGSPKWKHINYDRMTAIFGDYFERQGCKIYGVARHPADALVSWYRYRTRKQLKSPRHQWHDKYTGDIPFSQFMEEWANKSTRRARVPVSVEWCLTRKKKPAPMIFYRYEDLPVLFHVLSEHVGHEVTSRKRNVSPERVIDVERSDILALPRMQRYIELYDRIPFVGR